MIGAGIAGWVVSKFAPLSGGAEVAKGPRTRKSSRSGMKC